MITPETLRENLRATSNQWAALAAHSGATIIGPRLMPEVTLRAGIDCIAQKLPKRYGRGTPKLCFANAARLARRSGGELTYVEGYTASADLPIEVHHAWCIDAENRVIDPTLRQPEEFAYVGVPISMAFYDEVTKGCGSTSVFDGERGLRVDVLKRLCPSISDILGDIEAVP